jgi:hypothetical protein
VPLRSWQALSTPARPGPEETSNDLVFTNGVAKVTALPKPPLPVPQAAPAETMFPLASNWAQSPTLAAPPPNDRLPPRSDQALEEVQPKRFRPAAASVLKKVDPTGQVNGREVPVLDGLVKLAAEKSTLLLCVRKSIAV